MKEAAHVDMGGLLLSSRDAQKHLENRLIAIVPVTSTDARHHYSIHPEACDVFQPL